MGVVIKEEVIDGIDETKRAYVREAKNIKSGGGVPDPHRIQYLLQRLTAR